MTSKLEMQGRHRRWRGQCVRADEGAQRGGAEVVRRTDDAEACGRPAGNGRAPPQVGDDERDRQEDRARYRAVERDRHGDQCGDRGRCGPHLTDGADDAEPSATHDRQREQDDGEHGRHRRGHDSVHGGRHEQDGYRSGH